MAEKLVCDFSNISYRWRKKWLGFGGEQAELATALTVEVDDVEDKEDRKEVIHLRLAALQKMNEINEEMLEMAASVVKEVPDDWILDSFSNEFANSQIDWSDSDNLLDYIANNSVNSLMEGITEQLVGDVKN